jgi:D-alanyl-D-alanine carboxypeptidase
MTAGQRKKVRSLSRAAGRTAAVLALVLCAAGPGAAATGDKGDVADELRGLLSRHMQERTGIRGEAVAILRGDRAVRVAVGGTGRGPALTPDHMVRIASMTKPFTAAAILRLMEQGQIDITAPIGPYLRPDTAARLDKAGYDPTRIRVRDLLAHSSGLRDYAQRPEFMAAVQAEPDRRWTRQEQLDIALRGGPPLAAPGMLTSYSDTGYILLGEIIEQRTGKPLGPAVRGLLRFDRIGLVHSWWETMEPRPTDAPRAPVFLLDADVGDVHPSFDLFGGGGLVSNVEEVARFYRALLQGQVFDRPATLAILLTVDELDRSQDGGRSQANGVSLVEADGLLCWGHGGFWGSLVAHCPEADVTFAWSTNQAESGSTRENRRPTIDGFVRLTRRMAGRR